MLPSEFDSKPLTDQASVRFRMSLVLLLALIAVGTLGYMLLNRSSAFDALYMTIISITTVGYGETIALDQNPSARLFTMVLLMGGAGVTVYVSSNLTAFLVEGELSNMLWSRKMERKVRALSNHVIIAGGGQTASYTVREMLMAAGVERAQGLVSALPDDRDNLFVTISARGLNQSLRIVAKTVRKSSESKLRMAEANEVVCPDSIGGSRMASQILRPHVLSFVDTMLELRDRDSIHIEEVYLRRQDVIRECLANLKIPQRFGGALVLAIKHDETTHSVYNPHTVRLKKDDILIMMGPTEEIAKARGYFEHAG